MTWQEMLQVAIKYLEELPEDPQGFVAELLQEARGLLTSRDSYVTSLLLGDQEEFQKELLERPGEAETVLEEWRPVLERELAAAEAESPGAAGKVLAENLYNSLQHLYPSFGQQHP